MQHVFEHILNEASKARFINKADLTDEEKAKYIKFFDEHPSFDNLVNWQNPNEITRDKLEGIYNKYIAASEEKKANKEKYKKAINEGPKQLFLDRPRDFRIIDENDKFIFIKVLTYEGAKFCDSPECGGQGAKWCIGYEKDDSYWRSYTDEIDPDNLEEPDDDEEYSPYDDYYENNMYNNIFVMAFNKDLKAPQNQQKYMLRIRLDDASGEAWRQDDKPNEVIEIQDWPAFFGIKHIVTDKGPKITNIRNERVFNGIYISEKLQIGSITINLTDKHITELVDKVIIPDGVTTIGVSAFKGAKFHNGIELPSTLTRIGPNAFYGSNIKELVLPENFNSISSNALSYSEIERIILPADIYSIYTSICECKQLKEIVVTGKFVDLESGHMSTLFHYIRHPVKITFAESSNYTIQDGAVIRKSDNAYLCNESYLEKPEDKITELNIPSYVRSFCLVDPKSVAIENVYLPDNIEIIGHDAFNSNSYIKTIRWPKNLKKIEDRAFIHSSLEGIVEIPPTVEEIGRDAFTYCNIKLFIDQNKFDKDKICNDSVLCLSGKKDDFEYVDGILYSKLDNLIYYIEPNNKNLIIPNGIKGFSHKKSNHDYGNYFKNAAIPNYRNIETVILPDSFELKEYDFEGFESLRSITLPNNLTWIPPYCFKNCKNLRSIDIPDTVTIIREFAFYECSSISNIILPPGLTSINAYAFYNVNIKQLVLPKSIRTIDPSAFVCCYYLNNPLEHTVNMSYMGTKEEFENNVLIYHEGDLNTWQKPTIWYLPCTNGLAEVEFVF